MHCKQWERNQWVKDAVNNSKTRLQLLQQVNNKHMVLPSGTPAPDEDTDNFSDFGTSGHIGDGEDAGATHERSKVQELVGWVDITAATPMLQPNHRAI
jgi:hypothetical protein